MTGVPDLPPALTPAPVLDLAGALEFARQRRLVGERIVFTNGCFDLIHAGHVSYLQKARALGDCLILGLNSDASVRRLKGKGRPLMDVQDRAAVLAALRAVDAIVVFDGDTPRDLILALRPDVLVKGGDYTPATVVGANDLSTWGGALQLIPIAEGRSTTALLARIRNSME